MQPAGRRSVTDVALQGGLVAERAPVSRQKVLRRLRLGDAAFHNVTRFSALLVLVILSGVIAALVFGAWPALREFGLGFLFSQSWNPVTEKFGALAPVYRSEER